MSRKSQGLSTGESLNLAVTGHSSMEIDDHLTLSTFPLHKTTQGRGRKIFS